jgi:hypothetical protein
MRWLPMIALGCVLWVVISIPVGFLAGHLLSGRWES